MSKNDSMGKTSSHKVSPSGSSSCLFSFKGFKKSNPRKVFPAGSDDSTASAVSICRAEAEATTIEEAPPTIEETPPTYYFFKGVRFETFDALVQAMEAASPVAQRHGRPSKTAVSRSVQQLFRQYANGSAVGLQLSEFKGMMASLAAEFAMDPRKFGRFDIIFYRFDVNADGKLDKEECVMVAESMLRHYHHSLQTSASGGPKLLNLELKDLEANYEISEKMGEGGQGVVYLAREKATQHERVVKCYDKTNVNAPLEEIKEEFILLRSLDHPKIQRLFDIFEDRANVYVIAEPYRGGDLSALIENGMEASVTVTSAWLAKVVFQVLQGVAYLHSKYIIHCDLKESNVMIVSDDNWQEPSAVVIDFGMARNFAVNGTTGGTAGYIPPEVWDHGLWTPKGDVFALGVIMYQLFTNGGTCFKGWDNNSFMRATCDTSPDLQAILRSYKRCNDLLPLLESMLCKEFRLRPTVKRCMNDAFFVNRLTPGDDKEDGISEEVLSALSTFSTRRVSGTCELQRALSEDIASRLNLAEMRDLNRTFQAIDTDHDGVITDAEMRACLAKSLAPDELERTVRKVVGPDGKVAYTTFMGQLLASEVADASRLLWREFKQLDTLGTGSLSRKDVSQLLERPALAQIVGGRGVSSLMALMDADGDGHVSFEEFRRALGGEAKRGPEASMLTDEYQVNQYLEYNSPSLKLWIPCKVIAVDTNGSIRIDLRPGYWVKREEQELSLRPVAEP